MSVLNLGCHDAEVLYNAHPDDGKKHDSRFGVLLQNLSKTTTFQGF